MAGHRSRARGNLQRISHSRFGSLHAQDFSRAAARVPVPLKAQTCSSRDCCRSERPGDSLKCVRGRWLQRRPADDQQSPCLKGGFFVAHPRNTVAAQPEKAARYQTTIPSHYPPGEIVGAGPVRWQSRDCNLFALADSRGKIIGLHTTSLRLALANAHELVRRSLREDSATGWWFGSGQLFQVVLQPYYEDEPRKSRLLGTVIVGRQLDAAGASDLARISASHLVFRYGNNLVMSTFAPSKEQELAPQLEKSLGREEIRIGNEKFFASSLVLDSGAQPLSITVLKS